VAPLITNMANTSSLPRKRKCSGFDLLFSEIDSLSPSARHDLTTMIGPEAVADRIKLMVPKTPKNDTQQHSNYSSAGKHIVTSSMQDEEILSLVAQSRASLLGSICFLFVAQTTVSALQVVKHCGLVVDPMQSPGRMDARDVVSAALVFLCELSYLKAVDTKHTSDLLNQSYEKAYEWKWEDIKCKVMGDLEDAFYQDDPSHNEFLPRKRFLPSVGSFATSANRFNFVLKGVVPIPNSKTIDA
jgi:hypothetical protein